MKRQRKLRFRGSAVLLIVGCFLGLLFVQQMFVNTTEAQQKAKKFNSVSNQLKGSTKAPVDIKELEKGKAPPKGAQRKLPTMKALMDKVSKQPGGKGKVAAAKAGKPDKKILQGSTKAPVDIKELEKGKAPPKGAQRKLPTMKALMDKVSKQPGGKEKIQRATTKGKKSGIGSETTGILLSGLSELNPFKVKVAHAASTLSLTPNYPSKTLASNFYAYMSLYGAAKGYYYNSSYMTPLRKSVYDSAGYNVSKPYINLVVYVPSDGYYMINFETWNGATARLRTWKSTGYTTVQNWSEGGKQGLWQDHPYLDKLEKGWHTFYWILDYGWPYIYRVTVKKF